MHGSPETSNDNVNKFSSLFNNISSLFLVPTDREILKIISNLSGGKSPGNDGVSVELVKRCALSIVSALNNSCLTYL